MHLFSKILIANRGEIAVRIIRTAKKLAIQTVVIYSPADHDSLAVKMADEAFPLHSNELAESYLNIPKIIEIAKLSKAEAIHPGYGFLSENPRFVDACEKAGIVFIGPGKGVMQLMGNKIESRKFVANLQIPMTEGFTGSPDQIIAQSHQMSFPVLIKAAAGGGGKGMRIIHHPAELEDALHATSREAMNYFNDASIYVEKYIENPRHIEIQILADSYGKVVHLFERECSVQRRYQKIIEEAPAVGISPSLREAIAGAAVEIATATNYLNAGTIEFLADAQGNYYFLEMNTRIQVEHPVTEFITNIDIVEEQIKIAAGFPITYSQDDITQSGHAIECRIYAEDAENNFMPSPGLITDYQAPEGPGIRLDAAIDGQARVYPFYDPMICKLVVHGSDRDQAISKMIFALESYSIQGITTNIPYLLSILNDATYIKNQIWTKYCESTLSACIESIQEQRNSIIIEELLAAAIHFELNEASIRNVKPLNNWNRVGYWRDFMSFSIQYQDEDYQVTLNPDWRKSQEIYINDESYIIDLIDFKNNQLKYFVNKKHYAFSYHPVENDKFKLFHKGYTYSFKRMDKLTADCNPGHYHQHSGENLEIKAPMPGKIVRVNCEAGQVISKGEVLVIVESMKMENNLLAQTDGIIEFVSVTAGELVDSSKVLVKIANTE